MTETFLLRAANSFSWQSPSASGPSIAVRRRRVIGLSAHASLHPFRLVCACGIAVPPMRSLRSAGESDIGVPRQGTPRISQTHCGSNEATIAARGTAGFRPEHGYCNQNLAEWFFDKSR